MSYRIAGIDVHKKMLAVVIADVAVEGEYRFARRRVGTSPRELRELAAWLVAEHVEEAVMESTAQYWRPVWEALERDWQPARRTREGAGPISGALHLAQAQSNRGARGRKRDFPDAERLVKRLVAQELTLSFVPDVEQRLWRTVMRRKYQLTRSRVQVQKPTGVSAGGSASQSLEPGVGPARCQRATHAASGRRRRDESDHGRGPGESAAAGDPRSIT